MYTRSRYEDTVAFHVVIWMENIVDNNTIIEETTFYNFWLQPNWIQPNNAEWRCLKRVVRQTNLLVLANLARLD